MTWSEASSSKLNYLGDLIEACSSPFRNPVTGELGTSFKTRVIPQFLAALPSFICPLHVCSSLHACFLFSQHTVSAISCLQNASLWPPLMKSSVFPRIAGPRIWDEWSISIRFTKLVQSPEGQGIGSLKLFYALSCLVLQDYKIKGLASLSKLFYMPKSFSFFFFFSVFHIIHRLC